MELIHVVFWIMALLTVGSALMVAFSPKLIHSVFGLFFCFVGTAGLYVLLGADFLAATQVIIYIGGIMVLMIFGVMLTNRFTNEGQLPNPFTNFIPASLVALGLVFLLWSFPRSWSAKDPRWTRNFDDVAIRVPAAGKATEVKPQPLPGASTPAGSPAVAAAPKVDTTAERIPPVSNTTRPIGEALLTQYLIPFELASLVLLIAMLGAASIARKEIR